MQRTNQTCDKCSEPQTDRWDQPISPIVCPECGGGFCNQCIRIPIRGEAQPCLLCSPLTFAEFMDLAISNTRKAFAPSD